MSGKQRISYFPLEKMDAEMRAEMERCRREGTPRPESSAVRAHVPAAFWSFANSWRDLFHRGVCDHAIKELCRLYISRSVQCDYCGNQRSIKAASAGVIEDHVKDLLNFEKSTRYGEREKAALAYAAQPQDDPSQPIHIIVPFTPGSATDVVARLVAEKLNAAWGQPVLVENRPGAGGSIGIAQTAKADADAYTLAVVSTGHVV